MFIYLNDMEQKLKTGAVYVFTVGCAVVVYPLKNNIKPAFECAVDKYLPYLSVGRFNFRLTRVTRVENP